MDTEYKNNHPYSVTDIQKYLEGGFSVSDMHAIEAAALDDPFLADAIDGVYHNMKDRMPGSLDLDIDDLKNRLHKKINGRDKNKVILLSSNSTWWKIAAAIIVLLGASAITLSYFINNAGPAREVVLLKKPVIDSADIKTDIAKKITGTEANRSTPPALQKQTASSVPQKNKSIDKRNAEQTPNTVESLLSGKAAGVAITSDSLAGIRDSISVVTSNPVIEPKATANENNALADNRQKKSTNNFFEGKVVDENKQPVRGATVALKNKSNAATSTDANGYFKLYTSSMDTVINVVVNAVGYTPTAGALNNNTAANDIHLQASSSALNEVVVTGYGAAHKKDLEADDDDTSSNTRKLYRENKSAVNAIPATGWKSFNEYVDKNKKINTADSVIKGTETISFVVDKNGIPSSFNILKSLSPAHDAEGIRLIKQGPAWKPLKGKKAKTQVEIIF